MLTKFMIDLCVSKSLQFKIRLNSRRESWPRREITHDTPDKAPHVLLRVQIRVDWVSYRSNTMKQQLASI